MVNTNELFIVLTTLMRTYFATDLLPAQKREHKSDLSVDLAARVALKRCKLHTFVATGATMH